MRPSRATGSSNPRPRNADYRNEVTRPQPPARRHFPSDGGSDRELSPTRPNIQSGRPPWLGPRAPPIEPPSATRGPAARPSGRPKPHRRDGCGPGDAGLPRGPMRGGEASGRQPDEAAGRGVVRMQCISRLRTQCWPFGTLARETQYDLERHRTGVAHTNHRRPIPSIIGGHLRRVPDRGPGTSPSSPRMGRPRRCSRTPQCPISMAPSRSPAPAPPTLGRS